MSVSHMRGRITYDDTFGHVCECTQRPVLRGERVVRVTYANTVHVDRSVEPTNSGAWWYTCRRCGAGAWSGL